MAATVVVSEATGVTPDYDTVTAVRLNNADEHDPVLTNPCVIPSAGYNYSFWKHLFLSLSGTYTRINNVLFYTDGSSGYNLGTGGDVFVVSATPAITAVLMAVTNSLLAREIAVIGWTMARTAMTTLRIRLRRLRARLTIPPGRSLSSTLRTMTMWRIELTAL